MPRNQGVTSTLTLTFDPAELVVLQAALAAYAFHCQPGHGEHVEPLRVYIAGKQAQHANGLRKLEAAAANRVKAVSTARS
jgi:hypothetical protein